MSLIIAPSLLASDFSRIKEESEMLNRSQADWFHLDVMDGRFVPNISFGLPIISAYNRCTDKVLDVHLMMLEPENYIDDFVAAGADVLTVHEEASPHLHRTIGAIKEKGMKAGVALNPHTPISVLEEVISDVDVVCLMSVNPGFGGQKFITGVLDKCARVKDLIEAKNASAVIEIDGGVNLDNAPKLKAAGAGVLVAGSFVFKSENPEATIAELKRV